MLRMAYVKWLTRAAIGSGSGDALDVFGVDTPRSYLLPADFRRGDAQIVHFSLQLRDPFELNVELFPGGGELMLEHFHSHNDSIERRECVRQCSGSSSFESHRWGR